MLKQRWSDMAGDTMFSSLAYGGARIEGPTGRFRLAQYPDGAVRLQQCYQWSDEDSAGQTWREVPTAVVDASGLEIK